MRSTWQDPPEYSGGGEGGRPHMAMPPLTPMVKALVIANAVVFLATFVTWVAPAGARTPLPPRPTYETAVVGGVASVDPKAPAVVTPGTGNNSLAS